MRLTTILLLTASMLTAPVAMAGTLQEMTTKGAILSIAGFDLDLTFTPDGNFSSADGMFKGAWRIDGEKLCTTGEDKVESCVAYPADKKSGDKFDVTVGQGAVVTVTIK